MSLRTALLSFLLLVPTFNLLTVLALPWAINALVMHRIAVRGVDAAAEPADNPEAATRQAELIARAGINIALPAPRANADARTVVRPSPDLLYTACVFDLKNGPLHITAPVQDSYVSVSGFAADTSNFFALNDAEIAADVEGNKHINLLLTRTQASALPEGATRILAPSDRGLILFRSLITSEAALPELQAKFQAQQRCEPLQKP